jgi:transcriptional regulator with XRE-family HTH domain
MCRKGRNDMLTNSRKAALERFPPWENKMSTFPKLKTLGARLKWAREHKNWRQEDLALHSGVSRDVIAKTESGTTRMPKQLGKLAHALEVPRAWLAFGDERVEDWDEETFEVADAYNQLPANVKGAIRELILQSRSVPR